MIICLRNNKGGSVSALLFFVDNSLLYCRQGYMPLKVLKKMAPPPMKTNT